MCVDEELNQATSADSDLHVDMVDSWHKHWPTVLQSIERQGQRAALMVDAQGWLSARQCMLVAFDHDQVAGHLVFRVQPNAAHDIDSERPLVDARLDAMGVLPGFSQEQVRRMLVDAATRQARSLHCRRLIGFEPA